MGRGPLYVKVGGRDVPVAPCTVELRDGGVFVAEELERKSGKKTVTFRRVGTLDHEALRSVVDERRAA